MGRGEHPYARFGHAALRVRQGRRDRVYNYGYTDFTDDWLVYRFIRGRARFWVSRFTFAETLRHYRREGRAIDRQPLQLSVDDQRQLAALLRENLRPERRDYTYHHYFDNCTTRLRDLIDRTVDGALSRQLTGRATGRTLRQLTREGFAGRLGLLLGTELLLGRVVDRPIDRWQAAFLPERLAAGLQQVTIAGRPLAAPPRQVLPPSGPGPTAGDPQAGVVTIALVGLALLLLAGLGALALRHQQRWAGLPLIAVALTTGGCGAMIWTLALLSGLPELRLNELLLLLWPADLLLVVPAVRWLRGRLTCGRLLRGYLAARSGGILVVALAQLCGLLIQRPRVWLFVVLPLTVYWLALHRRARHDRT